MAYVDTEKFRPCGGFKWCSVAPGGCEGCQPWEHFLRLLALDEIEEKLAKGITIEQQKKEAQQVIQPESSKNTEQEKEASE